MIELGVAALILFALASMIYIVTAALFAMRIIGEAFGDRKKTKRR